MLAIGGAAGAASFTHVHDLAAAHRQGGWLAWADAIVLELMSMASGLEIRRRRRHRHHLLFPTVVLMCAVILSLAAQVIQAERSIIGWIAAAVPAAGFLTMVKIALGYHTPPSGPGPSAADRSAVTIPTGPAVPPADTAATEPDPPATAADRDHDGDTAEIAALLPTARQIAADLHQAGTPLTRGTLADAMRARGYAVSSARASAWPARSKPIPRDRGVTAPPAELAPRHTS
jgi:hypothetical protein